MVRRESTKSGDIPLDFSRTTSAIDVYQALSGEKNAEKNKKINFKKISQTKIKGTNGIKRITIPVVEQDKDAEYPYKYVRITKDEAQKMVNAVNERLERNRSCEL